MMLELFENNLFALILLGILFICTVVLCVHYFRFLKIKNNRQFSDTSSQKPISVVIATRNEHEQLRQNLPFFLQQSHSVFEVVVVIDDSDKDLSHIMQEFEKQYSNLKVVSFEWSRNFFVNQRFAESVGIKSATYDRIVLSDITTRPASPEWVSRMSNALSEEKKIVLGYYSMIPKPLFSNAFVRFETFFYTLQYFRAVLAGKPFTASTKNLAFERSLFYEAKGVAPFYNVNTGDEDMFVNKTASKINTTIEIHPNAFVKGQIKPNFNDWLAKRIRHRVLFKEFKAVNKIGLAVYDLFSALFYVVGALMLGCFFLQKTHFLDIPSHILMVAGGLFLLKFLIQWIVFKRLMSIFNERGFLLMIPVFDMVMLILQPMLLFTGLFTKRITWK